jgi:hypothetical protein
LARTVATCLLWENTFYESGNTIADRIADLCKRVGPQLVSDLAISARTDLHLRHVPLFLALQLVEMRLAHDIDHGISIVSETIAKVIQRPDEMSELLSLYWKNGKRPIAAQLKKGLALAFRKFSPYQLSKWDRESKITLRDVMFLTHPKPFQSWTYSGPQSEQDRLQATTWKKLANKELESADTWEVALSRGDNKKETWERLLTEKKLGYMALLANLRNMAEAKVDTVLVGEAIMAGAATSKALPFRFVSAAKAAPQWTQELSLAMETSATQKHDLGPLSGQTIILIDVSGSMEATLSSKSTISRLEAAAALAVLARGLSASCRVFTFSYNAVEVEPVHGLKLIEAVETSQRHGGTYLGGSIKAMDAYGLFNLASRLIVVTDEQVQPGHELPKWTWPGRGYVINVAPYEHGLTTKDGWVRINGWSDRAIEFIQRYEKGEFDD